jgi:hypothetical protein
LANALTKALQYRTDFDTQPELQPYFHIFPSDPGFQIHIAITIPIENISGKIGNRFSDQNRSAIFVHKSIPDFHFETGSRLKNCFRIIITDGAQNRSPILL